MLLYATICFQLSLFMMSSAPGFHLLRSSLVVAKGRRDQALPGVSMINVATCGNSSSVNMGKWV